MFPRIFEHLLAFRLQDQDKERASGDEEEGSAYQQLLISLASRRRKIQQRKVGHSGIAVVADGHSDGASSHAVCEESEETDGNPASEAEEDSDHGHMSEKEGGESEWESDDESGKETRDHFPSVKGEITWDIEMLSGQSDFAQTHSASTWILSLHLRRWPC